jgi:hypothetical protein
MTGRKSWGGGVGGVSEKREVVNEKSMQIFK